MQSLEVGEFWRILNNETRDCCLMQFVGVEAFITVCTDMFHILLAKKEIFIAVYCIASYLIGLTLVTRVC